jgi:hypothetical protein
MGVKKFVFFSLLRKAHEIISLFLQEIFGSGASHFENRNASVALHYTRTGSAEMTPQMVQKSKKKRKIIARAFLSLSVTGCGFQPLMTGQSRTPQRFALKIEGAGYFAYKFRRELEKQLALTPKINDQAYALTVVIQEGCVPLTYGVDATVSRNQVQATATYALTDGTQKLATGLVKAYSTYTLNYAEEFSTRSAQFAANEHALISLAEELAREIMLKMRSAPEKEEKPVPETQSDREKRW